MSYSFLFDMLFQAAMHDGSGIFGVLIILLLMLFFFAAMIFLFVFWILMIVDCAKNRHLSDGERIAWILVLVFVGFIGAAIYYFAVKRK